jgi:hypothetical protein
MSWKIAGRECATPLRLFMIGPEENFDGGIRSENRCAVLNQDLNVWTHVRRMFGNLKVSLMFLNLVLCGDANWSVITMNARR